MCGFVGYYVKQNAGMYAGELRRANKSLRHRGPDNSAIWLSEDICVGLGHTRLAILDLTEQANQPMVSASGRYILIYNGQVYNYIELARTHQLNCNHQSDTSVLLALIEKIGVERAVELLNGMFAFALFDRERNEFKLVRDSIGIKPLYWAKTDDGYIFGSELKALRVFSRFSHELSSFALYQYFQNLYIPAPYSIYESCYKLTQSSLMRINDHGVSSEAYKSKAGDYTSISSYEDAVDVLEELLTQSVSRHVRSDVGYSTFLSGGIDSSLIASLMPDKQNVSAYSIGYGEPQYDESARAAKIAEYLQLDHHVLKLTPELTFDYLQHIPFIYDEPFGDASCIPTAIVSSLAAKHSKVALSGDGADELFAGYPRYFLSTDVWRKISKLPYSIRNALVKHIIDKKNPLLCGLLKLSGRDLDASIHNLRGMLRHKNLQDFFHNSHFLGLPNELINKDAFIDKDNILLQQVGESTELIRTLLLNDQMYRLPDSMLVKVDRASMLNSLEVRVPYLDNEIVAFARSVDMRFLAPSNETKSLLRSLIARRLPRALYDMPKMGFHVPVKLWLRQHYSDYAADILFSSSSMRDVHLNHPAIAKLWEKYLTGDNTVFSSLWAVLMYLQWKDVVYQSKEATLPEIAI
jgi:asparagine synthase (glutamine-hydrolysing)